MRTAIAVTAGLACILAMPIAKADSAAEYNEGYNAGFENVAPPDTSSSQDYFAGWNAGQAAAQAEANAQTAPQSTEQAPSDSEQ